MATNAYYLNQFISTTLSTAGGIDDSQTTGIKIASTSGVTTDKPGILCLSYSDPIDTTKAEWISYTSIDVSNELQGVTRGEEGFSAKAHSNGVTVAFPISRSHINNLNDALIIGGAETNLLEGILDEDDMASNSATKGVTQQSAKAYVDNGTWLKDSIYRQAIINGNFDVWQRGVTATNLTSNSFITDRWKLYIFNTGTLPTTIINSKQTITPGELSGSLNFYRINVNGAGSGFGVNDTYLLRQYIENGTRFLGGGKKVTLSFWAKSDIANKKIGVRLVQQYGAGGTSDEIISGNFWTLTSSWQKITHTFTTETLAGKTFGAANDDSLSPEISVMWGSTRAAQYGDTVAESFVGSGSIDIAQVQLNEGSVALPFMPKSFEEELRACQRYYQKSWDYATAIGTASDNGARVGSAIEAVTGSVASNFTVACNSQLIYIMRTSPTVIIYSKGGTSNAVTIGAAAVERTGVTAQNASEKNLFRYISVTDADADAINVGQRITYHFTADAEL